MGALVQTLSLTIAGVPALTASVSNGTILCISSGLNCCTGMGAIGCTKQRLGKLKEQRLPKPPGARDESIATTENLPTPPPIGVGRFKLNNPLITRTMHSDLFSLYVWFSMRNLLSRTVQCRRSFLKKTAAMVKTYLTGKQPQFNFQGNCH